MGPEYGVNKLCIVPVICASSRVMCVEKTEAGKEMVSPSVGKIISVCPSAAKGNSQVIS